MTGQQRWEVKRSGASKSATISANDLAVYIQQGAVGSSHVFRLEGSTEWLSLDQVQLLLPEPESVTTTPPPPPTQSKKESTPAAPPSPNKPKAAEKPPAPSPTQKTPPPTKKGTRPTKKGKPPTERKSPQSKPPAAGAPAAKRTSQSTPAAKSQRSASPAASKQAANSRWKELPEENPATTLPEENPGMMLPALPPERKQRRAASVGFDEDDIDMTSMIDMTFLLLVFFMVTSTISPYANLQLPEARAGDAERPEGRVVMILDYPQAAGSGPAGDANTDDRFTGSEFIALKDCLLYLEGEEGTPIPPDALQSALQQAFEENGGGEFILQSNRKMPVGVVREVLKLAKSAGAGETMIGVARPR